MKPPDLADRADLPPHLAALPGGDFRVWRAACLRGAGFPASLVRRLVAAEAAALADEQHAAEDEVARAEGRLLEALRQPNAEVDRRAALRRARMHLRKGRVPRTEDVGPSAAAERDALRALRERSAQLGADVVRAFAAEGRRITRALREIAAEPRFREAVTWQNRGAVETALDGLSRRQPEGESRRSQSQREQEELVASYLQRYAAKNDTIGFFGPVAWARLADDGPAIAFRTGEHLLATRDVSFEQWAIDAVARGLSADPRLAPWMCPRRLPFVRLGDDGSVQSSLDGEHQLTLEEWVVLRAARGDRTARDLARALLERPESERDRDHRAVFETEEHVFRTLRALAARKLVAFAFDVPLTWKPEQALRVLLDRIDAPPLKAGALQPLDALDEARRGVAAAAGEPDQLARALTNLDAGFTRLTGDAATRQAGTTYAARQLVFEDCRRDLDLAIGPSLLASLGPPLSLVLASARWLTHETAQVYGAALRGIHAELRARAPGGPVRFVDMWFRAQRVLFGAKERPFDAIVAELEDRWSRVLGPLPPGNQVHYESRAIGDRVGEAFAAPGPGFRAARHHSPDIMIAAGDADAIRRGDCIFVLGEVHVGMNTLDTACLVAQHPDRAELDLAYVRDRPEPLVAPVYSKDWPKITVRTNRAFVTPETYFLETGFDPAPGPRDHVLLLEDLVVEERGRELVVRTEGTGPGRGPSIALPILEVFGEALSMLVGDGFRVFPRAARTPRLMIDRLVVSRESWTFAPSAIPFAAERGECARFVAARRWARAVGLPRQFFAKTAIEVKPIFVDLDSPPYVNLFARHVRRAEAHAGGETPIRLTEMLPRLDQSWLEGAADQRFTSELRIVVVDPTGSS
jgi:hypothetical protein